MSFDRYRIEEPEIENEAVEGIRQLLQQRREDANNIRKLQQQLANQEELLRNLIQVQNEMKEAMKSGVKDV